MMRSCEIDANLAEQRADRLVKKLCPELGLSKIHGLFRKKEIKEVFAGKKKVLSRGDLLQEGSTLCVYGLKPIDVVEDPQEKALRSKSRPSSSHFVWNLPVLQETSDLLVLNKPDTLCVHPGTGVAPGKSVIEQVHRYLNVEESALFKPSLVHRLDKETSGVLLVAKSGKALKHWTALLRDKQLLKKYWVLVDGEPFDSKGTIETLLTRVDSREGGAKSVVQDIQNKGQQGYEQGKLSKTHYKVLGKQNGTSLLEVEIETGRMHQIRAHMAHIGLPIVGDSRYGHFERNRYYKKEFGIPRLFLHARSLGNRQGETLFEAELPEKRQKILLHLGYR
jgi:23S rRNA pseudouridine955/2504/2580 synthase